MVEWEVKWMEGGRREDGVVWTGRERDKGDIYCLVGFADAPGCGRS
jgi:hypothetical protein